MTGFFTLVLAQQADVAEDIMEARVAIEHHAIRPACRRATQSDLDRIADVLDLIVETIHEDFVRCVEKLACLERAD